VSFSSRWGTSMRSHFETPVGSVDTSHVGRTCGFA
jgi:hypothetical protein